MYKAEIKFSIFILLFFLLSEIVMANDLQIGVKPGDWVKYQVELSPIYWRESNITWLRIDVVSVNVQERIVGFNVLIHFSNGSESSDTFYFNLETGRYVPDMHYFIVMFFIPSNLRVGDIVYGVEIDNEEIKSYAGSRRVVLHIQHASASDQYTPYQEFNVYFDKATGVLVEWKYNIDGEYFRITAVETNLWSREPSILDWLLWTGVIVAIVLVCLASAIVIKRKQKTEQLVPPPPPSPSPLPSLETAFFLTCKEACKINGKRLEIV